jgi:hypothetical protein
MNNKYLWTLTASCALGLASMAIAADGTAAAPATVNCKDGSTSTTTGKGACSHHGGVQKATVAAAPTPVAAPAAKATSPAAKAAPAAPKTASATKASNADPSGATAKCKDGTYSHSQHHSGSCSKHGGVAEFLTP